MPTSLTEGRLETHVGAIQMFRGGSGDPLVYLHSAGGESTNAALEDLADDYDVIVPVLPGYGESEGIGDIDDTEDMAFHLLDVWDRLGLASPVVMGLSLGAWMGLELATRYPERVGPMILVNPVGLYLDDAPIKEMFGRSPAELAEDMIADPENPVAQMMRAMAEWTGDVGAQMEIPLELVLPLYKSLSATAKIGWDPYLHNPKLRGRLHRVGSPVLIVRGARDSFVPEAHAKTYAAELPDARLEIIEDAAHLLPLEKPAELAAAARTFLASLA